MNTSSNTLLEQGIQEIEQLRQHITGLSEQKKAFLAVAEALSKINSAIDDRIEPVIGRLGEFEVQIINTLASFQGQFEKALSVLENNTSQSLISISDKVPGHLDSTQKDLLTKLDALNVQITEKLVSWDDHVKEKLGRAETELNTQLSNLTKQLGELKASRENRNWTVVWVALGVLGALQLTTIIAIIFKH